jgi:hypothetical protein
MPHDAARTSAVGAPAPSTIYYFTLAEIAEFLRVRRETIYRWLDCGTGVIQCPTGRTLQSVQHGERRLVSNAAWQAFVGMDAPVERPPTVAVHLAPTKRRGRPRKAAVTAGRRP